MGSNTAGEETIADRLAKYAAYGIIYEERPNSSGAGNVFYKGQPVKQFIDETRGGGVFSYGSRDGGELTVRAVYDESGALCGVEEVHERGVAVIEQRAKGGQSVKNRLAAFLDGNG